MTNTTGSDVELILDLELEMRDAERCEHSGHWWRSARNSDDSGAWLVLVFCECHEPDELIFCGKFKAWCEDRAGAVISCNECGRTTSPGRCYVWVKQL